jgi:hypothetical protein
MQPRPTPQTSDHAQPATANVNPNANIAVDTGGYGPPTVTGTDVGGMRSVPAAAPGAPRGANNPDYNNNSTPNSTDVVHGVPYDPSR